LSAGDAMASRDTGNAWEVAPPERGATPAPGVVQRVYGDRYAVIGEVGRGGSARVLRARDSRIGRDVAVKVLEPGQHDANHIHRFQQEARAA